MIRPITLLCFLLACGSGLYLYQSKHRVQMLDREIERTVHATEATRDQARLLGAEWMLLNDPERLRALAEQFLALRTVTPGQFTSMAELDHRLPPVRSPDAPLEPVPEPAVMTPMVPTSVPTNAAPPPAPEKPAAAPAPHPAAAPAPVVAERKPAAEKPRVASAQAEPRPVAEPRPAMLAAAAPRPAPRYVAPVATPIAQAIPQGGSVLGMAAAGNLPPPKPIALYAAPEH
jgi:hypothetical protein